MHENSALRPHMEEEMLVRFDSSVAGEIMMFADAARRLLQVAGKACSARGVITAEQIPEVVARLRAAVAREKAQQAAQQQGLAEADDEGPAVSLGQRAQPFIEMLELTARDEGFVLWEAPRDFDE